MDGRRNKQADEAAPRVLIVDRSADSRDVLRTVLELRGVEIFEAAEAEQGLALARRRRPHVIVLDVESSDSSPAVSPERYAEQVGPSAAPIVLLGKISASSGESPGLVPQDRMLDKPYHYGQLVRKIEELLADGRTAGGASLTGVPRATRVEPAASDRPGEREQARQCGFNA